MTEESLFDLLLNTPEAERAALLDRECAGDPALRGRVEALLAADAVGDVTLSQPGDRTASYSPPPPPLGAAGTVVAGRYRLAEPIGEGGMGSVWLAHQTEPVKRKVAVKLVKAGMDSKAVLARFDAERQALAVMDHPNIAKVLDGGLHDGRPYFVMELVKGVPITHLLRQARRLTPRRAARTVRAGLPGDPARAPEGHHPPRHQAEQRAGRPVRRQAGAQGDRLRAGQGDRRRADRPVGAHRVRRGRRHAAVHVPRAGVAQQPRHRHPIRRVLARCFALRTPRRQPAVQDRGAAAGRADGGAARRPRGRAAAAEREALDGRGAAVALGEPRHRPEAADRPAPERTRLDRDEGPRKRPHPPVRDGQRIRRRRDPLPDRRGRPGPPAERRVPRTEVRPPAQSPRRGRDGVYSALGRVGRCEWQAGRTCATGRGGCRRQTHCSGGIARHRRAEHGAIPWCSQGSG